MGSPKVIVQLYPMMPTEGEDDRKAKRPVGADRDLYHRVVHEWTDIIKEADSMGVWGCSTITSTVTSGSDAGAKPTNEEIYLVFEYLPNCLSKI